MSSYQIELSNSDTPSYIFTNKSAVTTTPLNDNKTYLHTSNAEINSTVITGIVLGPELIYMNFDNINLGPPVYQHESFSNEDPINMNISRYITDYHYISLDKYQKFAVYNENGIIPNIQNFVEYHDISLSIRRTQRL